MALWMVRAENDGRLLEPFFTKNIVAIGWNEVGDLANLRTYDACVEAVSNFWPEYTITSQRLTGGMLFRFAYEIQIGDRVITYDKQRRRYTVGTVSGEYAFAPEVLKEHPHTRAIEWQREHISRDSLSIPTKNTLGSALTLFLTSDEAEREIIDLLGGRHGQPIDTEQDAAQAEIFRDIETRSVEFIKDKIVRLSWEDMQDLVAGLLRAMGYKTRVSPAGADRGKDIVASPDGFGFEDPRIVVEVKHRPNTAIGSPDIRGFLGGRHPGDKGLYVSTGGFSKDGLYEAERANIPLTLMNIDNLVDAILDNYERMDMEAQRLIPLRRLYWPID